MKVGTLLLVFASALAISTPSKADFKLGWAGPLTGGSAALGNQALNGAKQAVEDINEKGGILGEKIVLTAQDDQGDPKQAVSVANRMVGDGIKFLVGHQNSGASIPASTVYAEQGVLEITPSSTNPTYTERGLWNTFRVCGRDDQQGAVAGQYLLSHYKGKKVFIVHDKTPYGTGLANEVRKSIEAGGLKEIGFEGITVGEKDYTALVSKIKASGADVVYIGSIYTEAGLVLRQMRDQALNIPMIGGDGIFSTEFAAIAGPAAEGTLITFTPDATKNPAAKAIIERLKAKSVSAEGYTLYGYAAVQVIAQAIAATGRAEPKLVAEKMKSGISFPTVIGPLSYDKKGDITRLDFVFYAMKNGQFQEVSQP